MITESFHGQKNEAPQKSVEAPLTRTEPAAGRLHEAAYTPIDSTQRQGGDFASSRISTEEREARSFLGNPALALPNDKGLESQSLGADGQSRFSYRAAEREDGLASAVRMRDPSGIDSISKEYEGRADGLLQESSSAGKGFRSYSRTYQPGRGPEGLTSESSVRSSQVQSIESVYEKGKHPDHLTMHTYQKTGSTEAETRNFEGRQDGLLFEGSSKDPDGWRSTKLYENDRRPDGLLSELKTKDQSGDQTERRYQPGKREDGILIEVEERSADGSKKREGRTFDPSQNADRLSSEHKIVDGTTTTIDRSYVDRADGMKGESIVDTGSSVSSTREFTDGSTEQRIRGADNSEVLIKNASDKSRTEQLTSGDGNTSQTKRFDSEDNLVAIEGKDSRGKYSATETRDSNDTTIEQRTYENGTVLTMYQDGKTGPFGASKILQEQGQPPVLFDAKDNQIPLAAEDRPIPVSTTFDANGSVTQRMSNGQVEAAASMSDYVNKTSPTELSRYAGSLREAALSGEKDVSAAAVRGLFEASSGRDPDYQGGAQDALAQVAQDPVRGESVREEAASRLGSSSSRERATASGVLSASVNHWGPQEVEAVSKNPSTELAARLSTLSFDQLAPHREALLEGLKQKALSNATDEGFSADSREGAIATIAAIGGTEGLNSVGLHLSDGDNPSLVNGDGTKMTFARTEKGNLILKDSERPVSGGLDGDTETRSFDASTGKVNSLSRRDQYGSYKENRFNATEYGTLSQRVYEHSVRTLLPNSSEPKQGDVSEILHGKGKPPVVIDAQGRKLSHQDSAPILVATSLEEPGQAKQIHSDGSIRNQPIADYVNNSDASQLVRHLDTFEKLAATGGDSSVASLAALSKVAGSGEPDSSTKASEALKRLSQSKEVSPESRKEENFQLPALQKGWGPYQALQQLQREGKINMSPDQMRKEAVRIRDREFARSGEQFFRVGDRLVVNPEVENKVKNLLPPERPDQNPDDGNFKRNPHEVEPPRDKQKGGPEGILVTPESETTYNRVQPTGYQPWKNDRMQGGAYDMFGRKVRTTDDFFAGRSDFVSVAIDKNAHVKDGQLFYSKELDQKYASKLAEKYGTDWQQQNRHMWLRATDTGGAFSGTWSGKNADSPTRIDIATGKQPADQHSAKGKRRSQASVITGSKGEADQISLTMVPESDPDRIAALRTAPVRPGKGQSARERSAYRDHGYRDEWRRGIRPQRSQTTQEVIPQGKIAHGIPGEYIPEKLSPHASFEHLENAKEIAAGRRPKGDCGRGLRESLNASGFNLKGGPGAGRVATELGRYLESTGRFDKIPLSEVKEFKDGDVLIRPWTDKRTRAKGGINKGDCGTLDRNGNLFNDGVSKFDPQDKSMRSNKFYNYSESYILRWKPTGQEATPAADKSIFRNPPPTGERRRNTAADGTIDLQNDGAGAGRDPKPTERLQTARVTDAEREQKPTERFPAAQEFDRAKHYIAQPDGKSCSLTSLLMAKAHHLGSRPLRQDVLRLEHEPIGLPNGKVSTVAKEGRWPSDLNALADLAQRQGLRAESHPSSGRFNQSDMAKLDAKLARGESALARVRNPRTGNNHYVYVAGREGDKYIVADPDRKNTAHHAPMTGEALFKMMRARQGDGGFVSVSAMKKGRWQL